MASAGMNTVAVGIAVQSDWDNRHFSSSLSLNVRRLFEFLLQFDRDLHQQRCHASYLARGNLEPFLHLSVSSAPKEGAVDWKLRHSHGLTLGEHGTCWLYLESATRSKLAVLNEKLTVLERQLEYLEAQFSTAVNSS